MLKPIAIFIVVPACFLPALALLLVVCGIASLGAR